MRPPLLIMLLVNFDLQQLPPIQLLHVFLALPLLDDVPTPLHNCLLTHLILDARLLPVSIAHHFQALLPLPLLRSHCAILSCLLWVIPPFPPPFIAQLKEPGAAMIVEKESV